MVKSIVCVCIYKIRFINILAITLTGNVIPTYTTHVLINVLCEEHVQSVSKVTEHLNVVLHEQHNIIRLPDYETPFRQLSNLM